METRKCAPKPHWGFVVLDPGLTAGAVEPQVSKAVELGVFSGVVFQVAKFVVPCMCHYAVVRMLHQAP